MWPSDLMHLPSATKGNKYDSWKLNDHLCNYFLSQKYNSCGRAINVVVVQGERRSVIGPELSLNKGWGDIAAKVEKFMLKGAVNPVVRQL